MKHIEKLHDDEDYTAELNYRIDVMKERESVSDFDKRMSLIEERERTRETRPDKKD